MGTKYEPKEGTGWVKGAQILSDVDRWRTRVADRWLQVTVGRTDLFVISRMTDEMEATVPMPEDLQRIEKDFGVHAWSFEGVYPILRPYTGQCLLANAVGAK